MSIETLTNFEIIKTIVNKLPEEYNNPRLIPLTVNHIALEWDFGKKYYVHLSLNTTHILKINYLINDTIEMLDTFSDEDVEYVSVITTDIKNGTTTIKGFSLINDESIEFLIKTLIEINEKHNSLKSIEKLFDE